MNFLTLVNWLNLVSIATNMCCWYCRYIIICIIPCYLISTNFEQQFQTDTNQYTYYIFMHSYIIYAERMSIAQPARAVVLPAADSLLSYEY